MLRHVSNSVQPSSPSRLLGKLQRVPLLALQGGGMENTLTCNDTMLPGAGALDWSAARGLGPPGPWTHAGHMPMASLRSSADAKVRMHAS